MDGSEELQAPSMGLRSSVFDLSCEMSFPLPSIGCAFFFSSLFFNVSYNKIFLQSPKKSK